MIIEFVADGAATSVRISAWAFMLAGGALYTGWKFTELYLHIIERAAVSAAKRFGTWRAPKSGPPAKSSLVRQTAPASRRRH